MLFFFLLKPLLARPPAGRQPIHVSRDEEPFLFEFVEALSRKVGGRMPDEIEVDLDINAAAGFSGGVRGLLTNRLRLVIGLPLAATLPLSQFTAILAHEFGHLSQGVGMRCYYLCAMINRWFARVIYERDAWDQRLKEWASGGWWLWTIVMLVAQVCVWLSRTLLKGLFHVSAWITGLTSRQMEFDADRLAVQLCGERAFVGSMHALPVIVAASQWAGAFNGHVATEGQLADDIPFLVRKGLARVDDETRKALRDSDEEVDMYSSHPPTKLRIARARELGDEGSFHVSAPTSVLFSDFGALCREVTETRYRLDLGHSFQSMTLIEAADVHAQGEALQESLRRMQEFFVGFPLGLLAMPLDGLKLGPPADPDRARKKLGNLRHEVVEQARELVQLRPDEFDERKARLVAAKALLVRHLNVLDPMLQGLAKEDVESQLGQVLARIDEHKSKRYELGKIQRRRIEQAFALAHVPEVRARMTAPEDLIETAEAAARELGRCPALGRAFFELGEHLTMLSVLLQQLEGQEEAPVMRMIGGETQELRQRMARVMKEAEGLGGPIQLAQGPLDLPARLKPEFPQDPKSFDAAWEAAGQAAEIWGKVVIDLQSRVAEAVLSVEAALSLAPLENVGMAGEPRAGQEQPG